MGLNPDNITPENTFGTIKEALNIMAGGTLSGLDDTIEFQLPSRKFLIVIIKLFSGKERMRKRLLC